MTSILQRLKAWLRLTPDELTLQYLRSHRDLLGDDDRRFVEVMRERVNAKLPLHAAHTRRLDELVGDLQSRLAW